MADGKPLIESGAQLMYLFDVFDPHAKTAEDRAIAAQWCMFANASLGPAIFVKEQREGGQMGKTFEVLDQILKKSPYLEGDRFGVSDVAVGCVGPCVCACVILCLCAWEFSTFQKREGERGRGWCTASCGDSCSSIHSTPHSRNLPHSPTHSPTHPNFLHPQIPSP